MNFNPFIGTYPVAPELPPLAARNTYHNRPMRNVNNTKQDLWEYREENYHTERAADMRMNAMASNLRKTLAANGMFIMANPEEAEENAAFKLPAPQFHSGDGSRWDEI